jgi:hypothetical protein
LFLYLALYLSVIRNSKRRRKIIIRQARSQISRAFTELEIGDDDLENSNCNIGIDTMVRAPATTEHSEKEKTDPKQKAKPGDNCRYEKGCLNIYILLNICLLICYPS